MTVGLHKLLKIKKTKKRLGRGIASRGSKSGRGMKGQKSRAGYSKRAGFEGGQTPLYQRVPKKRGAKARLVQRSQRRIEVKVGAVEAMAEEGIVGPGVFRKAGIVSRKTDKVRLIGGGEIKKKLTIRVHGASKLAKDMIEKAGGKVEIIE